MLHWCLNSFCQTRLRKPSTSTCNSHQYKRTRLVRTHHKERLLKVCNFDSVFLEPSVPATTSRASSAVMVAESTSAIPTSTGMNVLETFRSTQTSKISAIVNALKRKIDSMSRGDTKRKKFVKALECLREADAENSSNDEDDTEQSRK